MWTVRYVWSVQESAIVKPVTTRLYATLKSFVSSVRERKPKKFQLFSVLKSKSSSPKSVFCVLKYLAGGLSRGLKEISEKDSGINMAVLFSNWADSQLGMTLAAQVAKHGLATLICLPPTEGGAFVDVFLSSGVRGFSSSNGFSTKEKLL